MDSQVAIAFFEFQALLLVFGALSAKKKAIAGNPGKGLFVHPKECIWSRFQWVATGAGNHET